jgi:hypothetical protein
MLTEQELENIKQLFQSDNHTNHKLAIQLAIGAGGMTPLELAKKYIDGWFHKKPSYTYMSTDNFIIKISDYEIFYREFDQNYDYKTISFYTVELYHKFQSVYGEDYIKQNEADGRIINYIEEIINKTLKELE